MKNYGLIELGYNSITLDDCYANVNRTNGKIVANPEKFPYGMKNYTETIKAMGM